MSYSAYTGGPGYAPAFTGNYDPTVLTPPPPTAGGATPRNRLGNWRGMREAALTAATAAPGATMRGLRAAAPFAARVATPAVIAFQGYDTLTNQDNNYDMGGQLVGNVIGGGLGAGLGALTGPLAPIAMPILASAGAYLGGQLGRDRLNLIPDSAERRQQFGYQEQLEDMERQRNELGLATEQARLDAAQRDLDSILNPSSGGASGGGGGGGAGSASDALRAYENSLNAPGLYDQTPIAPREYMHSMYSPDGQMFQGLQAQADADFRRNADLLRLAHSQGMDVVNLNRASEQARDLLDANLSNRANTLSYLASMRPAIAYQ